LQKIQVLISNDGDIVTARQHGRKLAARLGYPPSECTLIATAISELARNILLFAGEGEIVLYRDRTSVVIEARDRGPGISDTRQAMRDGYSTAGGFGMGLPGTRRIVDDFHLDSRPGAGTIVTVRKRLPRSPNGKGRPAY